MSAIPYLLFLFRWLKVWITCVWGTTEHLSSSLTRFYCNLWMFSWRSWRHPHPSRRSLSHLRHTSTDLSTFLSCDQQCGKTCFCFLSSSPTLCFLPGCELWWKYAICFTATRCTAWDALSLFPNILPFQYSRPQFLSYTFKISICSSFNLQDDPW